MNETLMKGIIKTVKAVLPPEALTEALSQILTAGINYKNSIVLDPEKGESETFLTMYEVEGVKYTAIAVINKDNQILRFEKIQPLSAVVNDIVKSM